MRLRDVFILSLSLFLVLSCAKKKRFPDSRIFSGDGNSPSIQFDSSVDSSLQESMESDFEAIASLNLSSPPTGTEASYFQLSSFDGNSLSGWLGARVKHIIGENYSSSNVNYTSLNFFNAIVKENAFNPMLAAQTVMQNTGTGYWLQAKKYDRLYKMRVNNNWVEVKGPRVGVIQIGEALFGSTADSSDQNSLVNSLRRISTYFHEARHSDGHWEHAGFPHEICPDGDLQGEYACEGYANGPYMLQAILLESFYRSCVGNKDCSSSDGETLRLLAIDKRGRKLSNQVYKDPAPEQLP